MIFSAAIAASLLALVGADTHQYSDELITALMRSAKEHNLVGANQDQQVRAAPKSPGLRAEAISILKDKPKPKPKPSPTNYMIFTNHIDDGTCGDDSLIESHGYVIGHCFTGVGGLSGMYWSFTVTNDDTNYFLNYGFYADNECTINIFSDVETVPYGCALRGNAGGHDRSKRFSTSTRIPDYKRGALFYGYGTESDCKKRKSDDKSDDILVWSFLANNQCDPHIYSPVYGPHVTDETRTCKRKSMTAVLYDSNDLSCSGAITTSTTVTKEWDCAYASVSGVDGVYPDSVCV